MKYPYLEIMEWNGLVGYAMTDDGNTVDLTIDSFTSKQQDLIKEGAVIQGTKSGSYKFITRSAEEYYDFDDELANLQRIFGVE